MAMLSDDLTYDKSDSRQSAPPSQDGNRDRSLRRTVESRPVREEPRMSNAATRPPKHPPPWFVHTAWRVHRALYPLSGGRFVWTTSNRRGWGARTRPP